MNDGNVNLLDLVGLAKHSESLDKVRAEFSLTALANNLLRALKILGVEAMMAAVRA